MDMTRGRNNGAAPRCDVDIYADVHIENPVPAYHHMLSQGSVVWLEPQRMHAICGHDALTRALRDHAVFQSGAGVSINEEVNKLLVGSTLNSDPPVHDATRAITFKPLSPKALASVEEKVEKAAKDIVDIAMQAGQLDAAQTLAPYLPLTIVRDLVGLGTRGRDHMLDWAAATFELMGDPRDRRAVAVQNLAALRAFLEDPTTLSDLDAHGWAHRATQIGLERGFAPARAAELMRDYIAPSLDTTISAIGYAMMLFALNPDMWDAIRADRCLIPNAIEEVVRLNTPIKMFTRRVTSETEIDGVHLSKGERVLMVFGAANRDPAGFVDPDTFDVRRNTRGHVGFGHGVHACLGMHLARLEMRCLFNALADRAVRIELTGPVVPARNSTIHALKHIPIKLVPV